LALSGTNWNHFCVQKIESTFQTELITLLTNSRIHTQKNLMTELMNGAMWLINEIALRSKHSNPISNEGFAGIIEPNRDASNHTPKTIRTNTTPPLQMHLPAAGRETRICQAPCLRQAGKNRKPWAAQSQSFKSYIKL
jgi:hypothetical protein